MAEETIERFEVSPQQEVLWLSEPAGPSGRVQVLASLEGPLDADSLRTAVDRCVQRHEILRTSFVRQPGMRLPFQVVSPELDPAWVTTDLSAAGEAEQRRRLSALAADELGRALDYESGPLVRVALARLSDTRHFLLVTLSTLCADASSATLLLGEVIHHHTGQGELVEDPLQYADFSAWQRELESSQEDEALTARTFWSGVADATAPSLPFTHPASAPAPGEHVRVRLGPELVSSLLEQARRYGAAPSSLAQAAWHAVLGRSAGIDEVTIGLLASERRHPDLEGAIGAFARPVPARARVDALLTFAELLQQVQRASEDATVWQDYAPVAAPSLTVGFVSADAYRLRTAPLEASLERVALSRPGARLWVTCVSGEEELALRLAYDPAFIDRGSAERLAARLERTLASVAQDASLPLGEVAMLDDAERRLLLVEFNDSGEAIEAGTVNELFSAHAASSPTRAAVIDEAGAITYSELERRANQVAHRLRRAGVGPDVAVGLCTDRSTEMVVGLLGILKAGGAYVPLHYEHPPTRLGHQLASAGAIAVLTQEPLLGRLPDFDGAVICLDRDHGELEGEPETAPALALGAENLVYIIYTSGSTGAPKGVGVTHGNLVNYASDISRRLGADERPTSFGLVTSISTDLGNTSVFGALCSGGTLVLLSPVTAADAGAFARQAERSPIDVLKLTPSHAGALIAGGDARVLPRRWLVLGGERAPWDLVTRVRSLSDCRILNHYGPTEATVGCCTFPVGDGPGEYEPATVPIGRPIAGTRCYVVDERLDLVPLGAPGRLFVAGAGVARGYVGSVELTSERFVPDVFAADPSARMYDTGDIARWLPNGTLEFLGRDDEQVKIRGYRVEPAEVESALRTHPAVREAVVVARPGSAGDTRLVAYCTLEGAARTEDLRAHLAQLVPEFMVPSAILALESLPVTPSGKVDKLALPDPDEAGEEAGEYIAPRTPVEQALAEIWAHVLGLDRVGVEDDFFALGGHSLLATQVVAQVRSDFAVELPLHSLFTYPTVAALASEVLRMMGASEEEETAQLIAELEGLSDEEAERLLAGEAPPADV